MCRPGRGSDAGNLKLHGQPPSCGDLPQFGGACRLQWGAADFDRRWVGTCARREFCCGRVPAGRGIVSDATIAQSGSTTNLSCAESHRHSDASGGPDQGSPVRSQRDSPLHPRRVDLDGEQGLWLCHWE